MLMILKTGTLYLPRNCQQDLNLSEFPTFLDVIHLEFCQKHTLKKKEGFNFQYFKKLAASFNE